MQVTRLLHQNLFKIEIQTFVKFINSLGRGKNHLTQSVNAILEDVHINMLKETWLLSLSDIKKKGPNSVIFR